MKYVSVVYVKLWWKEIFLKDWLNVAWKCKEYEISGKLSEEIVLSLFVAYLIHSMELKCEFKQFPLNILQILVLFYFLINYRKAISVENKD